MKCYQCGTEFEGTFCPECGAKNEVETPVTPPPLQQQEQQSSPQSTTTLETTPQKKKKPIFLRWWFILLAIIAVGVIALSVGGGGEKIVWEDMILGDMLPEPPANRGEIHTNSNDELWLDINDLSDKQFNDYVSACKEKGFTVDAESDSSSYDAYNAEGYKLSLGHYGSDADMGIQLKAPMEMTTITWPTSAAGKQLPTPKSTTGKFAYEYDDSFLVYIGNTSKADYAEYVNACSEKGFNVDFDKSENDYYADNSEGWNISVSYEGNNIMRIEIDAPSEDDAASTTTQQPTVQQKEPAEKEPVEEKTAEPKVTKGEKNALDSALSYLDYSAFSKSGLKDQLEYEGYTESEIEYAVENCGANWKEQAALMAQEYLDYSSFSRQELIDQLEFEGFTSEQAEYGVSRVYD